MTPYDAYLQAEYNINEGLIRLGLSLEREGKFPWDPKAKMAETRNFLDACGNPQKGIPAVHVAGTSGKGSVAAGIAGILTGAGLKVGLPPNPNSSAIAGARKPVPILPRNAVPVSRRRYSVVRRYVLACPA